MTTTQENIARLKAKTDGAPKWKPKEEKTFKGNGESANSAGESAIRFKLKSIAEVCAAQLFQWLVLDLIPARGLFVMYGAPGSAKSVLAIDLAAHLVRKRHWLGPRR